MERKGWWTFNWYDSSWPGQHPCTKSAAPLSPLFQQFMDWLKSTRADQSRLCTDTIKNLLNAIRYSKDLTQRQGRFDQAYTASLGQVSSGKMARSRSTHTMATPARPHLHSPRLLWHAPAVGDHCYQKKHFFWRTSKWELKVVANLWSCTYANQRQTNGDRGHRLITITCTSTDGTRIADCVQAWLNFRRTAKAHSSDPIFTA